MMEINERRTGKPAAGRKELMAHANALRLNVPRLHSDLASHAHLPKVREDFMSGVRITTSHCGAAPPAILWSASRPRMPSCRSSGATRKRSADYSSHQVNRLLRSFRSKSELILINAVPAAVRARLPDGRIGPSHDDPGSTLATFPKESLL
jgi:hypothetical protein